MHPLEGEVEMEIGGKGPLGSRASTRIMGLLRTSLRHGRMTDKSNQNGLR